MMRENLSRIILKVLFFQVITCLLERHKPIRESLVGTVREGQEPAS